MPDTDSKFSKNTFVTGGSGLVGSHLIASLIKQKHNVTALYRKAIPAIANADHVNWVQGDILDVVFLQEAMAGMQDVYHCAAIVSFQPKHKHAMFQTNVQGTANVMNAALNEGIRKLCYVSSVAALSTENNESAITEDTTYTKQKFSSNYSLSKYLAEAEVWRAIGEGLNCVIVNPAIILGSGNWTHGSAQIFKTAYEAFPWYAEGTNGFTDVADVVNAMLLLMTSDVRGERFIICAENKSYKEVFCAIANGFGKPIPYKKVTAFLAGVVWRLEALKSFISRSESLVTRETAKDALIKVAYDNTKLQKFIPSFRYTPFAETIDRICKELKENYSLV